MSRDDFPPGEDYGDLLIMLGMVEEEVAKRRDWLREVVEDNQLSDDEAMEFVSIGLSYLALIKHEHRLVVLDLLGLSPMVHEVFVECRRNGWLDVSVLEDYGVEFVKDIDRFGVVSEWFIVHERDGEDVAEKFLIPVSFDRFLTSGKRLGPSCMARQFVAVESDGAEETSEVDVDGLFRSGEVCDVGTLSGEVGEEIVPVAGGLSAVSGCLDGKPVPVGGLLDSAFPKFCGDIKQFGYCYLALFAPEVREQVVQELGYCPTAKVLLPRFLRARAKGQARWNCTLVEQLAGVYHVKVDVDSASFSDMCYALSGAGSKNGLAVVAGSVDDSVLDHGGVQTSSGGERGEGEETFPCSAVGSAYEGDHARCDLRETGFVDAFASLCSKPGGFVPFGAERSGIRYRLSAQQGGGEVLNDHSGLSVVDSYGQGACYLHLIRKGYMSQVFSHLGLWPSLMQLVQLPQWVFVDIEDMKRLKCVIEQGNLHVGFSLSGFSFVGMLARLPEAVLPVWLQRGVVVVDEDMLRCEVDVSVSIKVGGSTDMVVGASAGEQEVPRGKVKLTLLKGGKGKASCSHCRKVVDPQGHAEVCPKRPSVVAGGTMGDARQALVGDAMHTADVRTLMAAYLQDESRLSVASTGYTSAVAQRKYMEMVDSGVLEKGRSDHAWGTAFEVRYFGAFRRSYLRWFMQKNGFVGVPKCQVVVDRAKGFSSLLGQVVEDAV